MFTIAIHRGIFHAHFTGCRIIRTAVCNSGSRGVRQSQDTSAMNKCLALACVAALAFGRRSEAFCGGGDGGGGTDDFVTCLKVKAIATLDRLSRADALPLTGSVTLVRNDDGGHRRRRSDDRPSVPSERELLSKPDGVLDRILYDRTVGLFSGRAVKIGLPELTQDQLNNVLDEGNYAV